MRRKSQLITAKSAEINGANQCDSREESNNIGKYNRSFSKATQKNREVIFLFYYGK